MPAERATTVEEAQSGNRRESRVELAEDERALALRSGPQSAATGDPVPAPLVHGLISRRLPLQLRRRNERERLDEPGHDRVVLAGALEDVCRVHRWLGGMRLTRGMSKRRALRAIPVAAESELYGAKAAAAEDVLFRSRWV